MNKVHVTMRNVADVLIWSKFFNVAEMPIKKSDVAHDNRRLVM